MLDLTPVDIRQKQYDFQRRFRGWDPEQVGQFLDEVADAMERLVEENRLLGERVAHLEEINRIRAEREQSVVQALTMAEELREESREAAEREASLLIARAQNEAHDIRLRAAEALEAARQELRRLHARRSQLVWSYRSFLQHELGEVESLDRQLRARAEDAGFADLYGDIDPAIAAEKPIPAEGEAAPEIQPEGPPAAPPAA